MLLGDDFSGGKIFLGTLVSIFRNSAYICTPKSGRVSAT